MFQTNTIAVHISRHGHTCVLTSKVAIEEVEARLICTQASRCEHGLMEVWPVDCVAFTSQAHYHKYLFTSNVYLLWAVAIVISSS